MRNTTTRSTRGPRITNMVRDIFREEEEENPRVAVEAALKRLRFTAATDGESLYKAVEIGREAEVDSELILMSLRTSFKIQEYGEWYPWKDTRNKVRVARFIENGGIPGEKVIRLAVSARGPAGEKL